VSIYFELNKEEDSIYLHVETTGQQT